MSLLALSLRSVVRGRRVVAVGLLPLLVALVALLLRATADDRTRAYGVLVGELLLPLVLGLLALVLGVNAFGDEREEKTLGLLLATTVPRWRIVLTKYVAAVLVTWLAVLPAVAGLVVLGSRTDLPLGELAVGVVAASLLGALAYVALFLLLSLLVARAVLVGLAYLVLWEGLLAGNAVAFRNLSVGAHTTRIAGAPWPGRAPFDTADVSVAGAVAALVVVTVVALALACRQLPRTSL